MINFIFIKLRKVSVKIYCFIFFLCLNSFKYNKIKKKNYYIIYEVFYRDFLPRLIIALRLSKKKNNVVLISLKKFIQLYTYLPPGIVLLKTANSNLNYFFQNLINNKFILCVQDEEQLNLNNSSHNFYEKIIDKNIIKKIHTFFFWGKSQYDFFTKRLKIYKPGIISGSSKYDLVNNKFLYLYDNERIEIKKKYQKFILITSNFGDSTFPLKERSAINFAKAFEIKFDRKFENFWNEFYYSRRKVAFMLIDIIYKLEKEYNDMTIILRPHPSDNHNFWYKNLKQSNRIKIEYEYSVNSWILESKLHLHHYCTTSIESFFLNKNSLCYSPFKYKNMLIDLYFKTSPIVKSYSEIIKYLKKSLNNQNFIIKKNAKFNNAIINNKKILAYKKIADHLNKINIKKYNFSKFEKPLYYAWHITNVFFGFLLKFDKYNYNKSIKGLENKELFFSELKKIKEFKKSNIKSVDKEIMTII